MVERTKISFVWYIQKERDMLAMNRLIFLTVGLITNVFVMGKCAPPDLSVWIIRGGTRTEILANYADPFTMTYGTLYLLPGDSIRAEGSASSCQAIGMVHDGQTLIAPQSGMFTYLFSATGTWTILDYGDESWIDYELNIEPDNGLPHANPLDLSVMLGGAMTGTLQPMSDNLAKLGLIPLQEPYSARGWTLPGTGGETSTQQVLHALIDTNGVVDWVLIEAIDAGSGQVADSRCALLRQQGWVLSPDAGYHHPSIHVVSGSYHIRVRHRNHLPLYSKNALMLRGGNCLLMLTDSAQVFGYTSASVMDENYTNFVGMVPGDVSHNSTPCAIKYLGAENDRDAILQRVGGTTPAHSVNGYFDEDTNLDGVVKYIGANNDRDLILQTIGGSIPNAVRTEQIP